MVNELLSKGAGNPHTGRELAALLNIDIRTVTALIEKERRQGQPICANMMGEKGYFLAADPEELDDYCARLEHRENELTKTRLALLQTLKNLTAKREQEAAENGKADSRNG